MGRSEGFIAVAVGLSGGAENVLIPTIKYDINKICGDITKGRRRGKVSWIIVVAEGVATGAEIADLVQKKTGYETRATTLGHIQRGGSPTAFDRLLASRMGAEAVQALIDRQKGKMVAMVSGQIKMVALDAPPHQLKRQRMLDQKLYKLIRILAT